MRNSITLSTRLCLLFVIAVLLTKDAYTQTIIKVTDCNLSGWVKQPAAGTTVGFTKGPANTPLSEGSVEYYSPTQAQVRLRSTAYHNTLLSTLTEFRYSAYVQSRQNNTDDVYVILQVDGDGDGIPEGHLIFDPSLQTAPYITGSMPDQGPTLVGIWQTWDMLHGLWWDGGNNPAGGLDPSPTQGGTSFSLATYISQHPGAKLLNQLSAGGTGAIRFSFGCPIGSAICGGNFRGNADAFTVGINGQSTIYDFEPSIASAGPDKIAITGNGSNCIALHGTGSGGVAPYTYTWSDGSNTSNGADMQVCATTTTKYTLTVTDSNNCKGTDDVIVTVNTQTLPLNIVRFNGQLYNQTVLLKWQAENETNNRNYVVERSSNGSNFNELGKVVAINTIGSHTYNFTDTHPIEPTNYYRLKIEDKSGYLTYSNILPIKINSQNTGALFYPNPAKDNATILFHSNVIDKYSIVITDATGKLLRKIEGVSTMGTNSIGVNVTHFSAGIYYITITNQSGKQSLKFNKQ
jgi:hypothetical protein